MMMDFEKVKTSFRRKRGQLYVALCKYFQTIKQIRVTVEIIHLVIEMRSSLYVPYNLLQYFTMGAIDLEMQTSTTGVGAPTCISTYLSGLSCRNDLAYNRSNWNACTEIDNFAKFMNIFW